MLSHLSIKNFALIDSLQVDFHKGLNIITGETGAGKSIIFEAIHLGLGSRADTTFIRKRCDKAVIQLMIDVEDKTILDYISSLDVEVATEGESLILTREIHSSGKSICKINDRIITVTLLHKISKKLADIHGQYDHQSLLNPENHIQLVDSFQKEKTEGLKIKVQAAYEKYISIDRNLKTILANQKEAARKLDFLKYELAEIDSAHLRPDEDIELQHSLNILVNSEKIYSALSESYELSYASTSSAVSHLNKILSLISSVSEYDPTLKEYHDTLETCMYQIEDLSHDIRKYKDRINYSTDEIDTIQLRLEIIDGLKRKYGKSIEAVLTYKDKIEKEIDTLENAEYTIESLKKDLDISRKELLKHSLELRALRKESSVLIEKNLEKELKSLHFNNSIFSVQFAELPEKEEKITFSENGIDRIEFLISTNKGEPLKPLSKIASGGEMSRIMLAFKKIINSFDNIPTMIFDEIDTGISGIAAGVVGKSLREISANHQVICITHLPQIASMGDHHYSIQKQTLGNDTFTFIKELT
ncbi:MAG: DNA repair protein RecN, partial [Peptostreptococcales bacterium]